MAKEWMKSVPVFLLVILGVDSVSANTLDVGGGDEFGWQDSIASLAERMSGEWVNHYFAYSDDGGNSVDDHVFQSDLKVSFSESLNNEWSLKVVTRFRGDTTGHNSNGEIGFIEDDTERYFATIDELEVEYYAGSWGLSVGKQFHTWSVGDLYRPTDVINPLDVSDLPTLEKIGVPAVSFFRQFEVFDLNAVLVPVFTPSRLPLEDNRWFPSLAPLEASLIDTFGFLPTLNFGERELPARQAKNFQGGLRFTSSSLIPGWDISASYFRGIDPVGVYQVSPNLPVIDLVQVFPEYQEWGGGFSTALGAWTIYGEIGYHLTDDSDQDDSFLKYMVGANYSNYDWFGDLFEQTRIVFEYAGESVVDERDSGSAYVDTRQYKRPFDSSILWSVVFQINIDAELRFGGAYNLNGRDAYLSPSFYYKFENGVSLVAGLDFFSGASDTFFGAWADDDRFSLSLEYLF